MKRIFAISAAFALSILPAGSTSEAMDSFTTRNILNATAGRAIGLDDDTTFPGISTDSRTIKEGELFWALSGQNHDGHDWINESRNHGAAAVISHREHTNGPAIIVDDTLRALQHLAVWQRVRRDALVIGVTGSFGKTTTREMIHAALSAGHDGLRSPHNYNNHIGVPLTLLNLNEQHEYAVIEMGASAVGEIEQLANIAGPEVGVITGIGPAHLEGFGSIDAIIQAKAELLQALPTEGFAILNGDDQQVRTMAQYSDCPVIFVGENDNNDLQATDIDAQIDEIRFKVDNTTFTVNATGRHHVTAALAAIAVGREIGMSSETLANGLADFRPTAGRSELKHIGLWSVIDDTYNANPASMHAACATLRDWTGQGKRILIAGDMLELGDEADDQHQQLGATVASHGIECLATYGTHNSNITQAAVRTGMHPTQLAACDSLETLKAVLDCWLEPGDLLLIKGSRGLRMERVVHWLEEKAAHEDSQENINRAPLRLCA